MNNLLWPNPDKLLESIGRAEAKQLRKCLEVFSGSPERRFYSAISPIDVHAPTSRCERFNPVVVNNLFTVWPPYLISVRRSLGLKMRSVQLGVSDGQCS